jgi:hypothetical protein
MMKPTPIRYQAALLVSTLLSLLYSGFVTIYGQTPHQSPERLQWRMTPKPLKQWLVPDWPNQTTEQLTAMEHQLYNQTYPYDTPARRVTRLEQSLGLQPDSVKPIERLAQLRLVFNQSQQQSVNQKSRADIGLLENRLLQNRFDHWPMPRRLAQLETLTFGQTYEQEQNDSRLNRLFEQIPLSNKSVRFITNP